MAQEFGGTLIGIERPLIVAVDAGATRTRIAMGREVLNLTTMVEFPTDHDFQVHTDKVAEHIEAMTGKEKPIMVGYDIAGEVSADGLTIVKAGQLHAYGWTGKPITAETAAALNIDNASLFLLNDLVSAGFAQREADRQRITGDLFRKKMLRDDYAGAIMTISTGNNTAVYSAKEVKNTESGHEQVEGLSAEVACGCGQFDDAEALISGTAILNRFRTSGKDIHPDDSRWASYRETLLAVLTQQLQTFQDRVGENGQRLRQLSLFGSVALGNSGAVTFLQQHRLAEPAVSVVRAKYGDHSGLYGAFYAAQERLDEAA